MPCAGDSVLRPVISFAVRSRKHNLLCVMFFFEKMALFSRHYEPLIPFKGYNLNSEIISRDCK